MEDELAPEAEANQRTAHYEALLGRLSALLDGEDDWVSAMATVACELHHGFSAFHWTGFYRVIAPNLLAIGPYQGGHGCLRIDFDRGVCGAAARTNQTIRLGDVHAFPGHIACSSTTISEIVVPIVNQSGQVMAVLDVDSDLPNAFDEVDQHFLAQLCLRLGQQFGD